MAQPRSASLRSAAQLLALLWGFAEATLFFLVPDLLLSFMALRSRRWALIGCLSATVGAVAGGAVMYAWGAADPPGAKAALEHVPAVSRQMVDRVESAMAEQGLSATFAGAFSGTPYKIYAVVAGAHGLSVALFLLVSIPARLARLLLVTLLFSWLSAKIGPAWTPARKQLALAGLWALFYTAFFALMPS